MADKYISQLPLANTVLASDHIITDNGVNTTRASIGSLSSVYALRTQTALAQSVSTADIQDYLLMYGDTSSLSSVELKITLGDLAVLLENLVDGNSLLKYNFAVEDGTVFPEPPTGSKSVYYVQSDVTDFYTLLNGHSARFTYNYNPTSYGDNYMTIETAPALSASKTTLYAGDYMFFEDPTSGDILTFYYQATGSALLGSWHFTCINGYCGAKSFNIDFDPRLPEWYQIGARPPLTLTPMLSDLTLENLPRYGIAVIPTVSLLDIPNKVRRFSDYYLNDAAFKFGSWLFDTVAYGTLGLELLQLITFALDNAKSRIGRSYDGGISFSYDLTKDEEARLAYELYSSIKNLINGVPNSYLSPGTSSYIEYEDYLAIEAKIEEIIASLNQGQDF